MKLFLVSLGVLLVVCGCASSSSESVQLSNQTQTTPPSKAVSDESDDGVAKNDDEIRSPYSGLPYRQMGSGN